MLLSFLFFLALFMVIGVSSAFFSENTKHDYYLASKSIHPALVGLSAVATNNSGYMFIGAIGYTYVAGLSSIWLMVGWILGDFMTSFIVHSRLRDAAERSGESTYVGVINHWFQNHPGSRILQSLMALISLTFLMAYAGAQFVAGSKALFVLFHWPLWCGAALGAVLVLVYCISGGIRASIWTDAAQSLVMIVSMSLLLYVAVDSLGGVHAAVQSMDKFPGFLDWVPADLPVPGIAGGLLFIAGWFFAGFSVIGQPHIMVRFMVLNDPDNMFKARCWYYLWFFIFYSMTICVGMLSRVYLTNQASFDAELALPTMALHLLHPIFVGLILAGIFAATMSTADSIILSCSASLTHDLLPMRLESPAALKAVTALVTVFALGWALSNKQSVFSLVIMAWSSLASAFAPLLLFRCFRLRTGTVVSVVAIVLGLGVSIVWRLLGWQNYIYEGMPGMCSGLIFLSVAYLVERTVRSSSEVALEAAK